MLILFWFYTSSALYPIFLLIIIFFVKKELYFYTLDILFKGFYMFDLISDIHIDKTYDLYSYSLSLSIPFYLKNQENNYLIIAGDVSNDLFHIKIFLEQASKQYKKVFYVIGNHEFHLINNEYFEYETSYEKYDKIKNLDFPNVFVLDGDVIEVDSIKIGGAMGWYDASYVFYNLNTYNTKDKKYILNLWNNFLDSKKIKGFEDFYEIFNIEIKKIKKISSEANIIISHFMPLIKPSFIQPFFRDNDTTGFYCFNGEEFLFNDNVKVWIYGHIHDINGNFFLYDKDIINAFPYLKNNQIFMKEITKDMIF